MSKHSLCVDLAVGVGGRAGEASEGEAGAVDSAGQARDGDDVAGGGRGVEAGG